MKHMILGKVSIYAIRIFICFHTGGFQWCRKCLNNDFTSRKDHDTCKINEIIKRKISSER